MGFAKPGFPQRSYILYNKSRPCTKIIRSGGVKVKLQLHYTAMWVRIMAGRKKIFRKILIFIAHRDDVRDVFFRIIADIGTIFALRTKYERRSVAVRFQPAVGGQKGKFIRYLAIEIRHIRALRAALSDRYFFHNIIVCRKDGIIYSSRKNSLHKHPIPFICLT